MLARGPIPSPICTYRLSVLILDLTVGLRLSGVCQIAPGFDCGEKRSSFIQILNTSPYPITLLLMTCLFSLTAMVLYFLKDVIYASYVCFSFTLFPLISVLACWLAAFVHVLAFPRSLHRDTYIVTMLSQCYLLFPSFPQHQVSFWPFLPVSVCCHSAHCI